MFWHTFPGYCAAHGGGWAAPTNFPRDRSHDTLKTAQTFPTPDATNDTRPCPACGATGTNTRVGFKVEDVDPTQPLFWACAGCGYAWPTTYPLGSWLDVQAKRAVVAYLAPPGHPLSSGSVFELEPRTA